MYRHCRYAPPRDRTFRDVLGRRVSPAAVREGVHVCHRTGIAALSYGSVYGAEREYADAHPAERVFDEAGTPLSLGDTSFLTDLRPGSPWRRRLLREYVRACRDFGFDGIHMDTYGEPHHVVAADGTPFRFEDLYPGLIEEAAGRLASEAGRRVVFNCVAGYPLDAVAPSPAAALCLELWPPASRYRDVVAWIEHAREVGGSRAIIIAAYVSALRDTVAVPERRAEAEEAVILLSSVIMAAGGYHQILAGGDRALVEGYYPAAARLSRHAARELQAAWRFGARYVHLVSDPRLVAAPSDDVELTDSAGRVIPTSAHPEAGHVWLRVARAPTGLRVVNVVDLRGQQDDRWDARRQIRSQ
jgi:dextranase